MDFDELLDKIKKENPEDRLTIELAQLAADMATEMIRELELRYVIRCKDCSYCRELRRNDPYEDQFAEGCMWCMNISDGVNPDGYCSNAKKKEDENG